MRASVSISLLAATLVTLQDKAIGAPAARPGARIPYRFDPPASDEARRPIILALSELGSEIDAGFVEVSGGAGYGITFDLSSDDFAPPLIGTKVEIVHMHQYSATPGRARICFDMRWFRGYRAHNLRQYAIHEIRGVLQRAGIRVDQADVADNEQENLRCHSTPYPRPSGGHDVTEKCYIDATLLNNRTAWVSTISDLKQMVDRIASEHGVDSLLVHSVIRAESNYHTDAVSPKGAQGIMQLTPQAARRFGVSDILDPQDNIRGGVRYLRFLLDYYQGDYIRTIAAYNAGQSAVEKYHGVPPFAETQSYVFQVSRNMKNERAAFADLVVKPRVFPKKTPDSPAR